MQMILIILEKSVTCSFEIVLHICHVWQQFQVYQVDSDNHGEITVDKLFLHINMKNET